ncbi:MAG: cbb3-type cytochrome c oxidase subunit 3 [Chromatiales bacterium]|nr:cbb3-type cytochrome c oxidase subunit 3 [Chromatiales bacterium]
MAATLNSIWTVVALLVFLGIVAWAWSSRRKADFEEASRLPLDDDQPVGRAFENPSEDKKNV